MRKIILASGSPRRKELLTRLIGDNFQIIESEYEEDNNLDMDPVDLVKKHALNKGLDVRRRCKNGIIISGDCIVLCSREVLGKPHTEEKAREMLKKINGKWVGVIGGIAVIDVDNNRQIVEHEITKVKIAKMTPQEIEKYIKTGEPLDKAGAFGVLELGMIIIEKVEGCFYNVIGMSIPRLYKILKKLNVDVFEYQ